MNEILVNDTESTMFGVIRRLCDRYKLLSISLFLLDPTLASILMEKTKYVCEYKSIKKSDEARVWFQIMTYAARRK